MLLFSFIQEKKTYGYQEIPDFLKNVRVAAFLFAADLRLEMQVARLWAESC